MKHSHSKQHLILGIFVITLGVLALVDRFNIFHIGSIFQFWPTVFILIGLLKITGSKSRASIITGTIFIAVGMVLMLSHVGLINFSWGDWWPVILIVVGIAIVFKDRSGGSRKEWFGENLFANENSSLDITAVMGGNKTVNNSQDFKGGELTAIMGGIELDLRTASIQQEAILNIWATWGGIVIKIPADWTVVNRGMAIMGGIEDKSFASSTATKRLIITGTAIMGGVEIKN
jgi:predicted membrane protein